MKIYTLQDYIENNIPKKENFSKALEKFETLAVLPFLQEEVIGGFAYGSFRTGDHTPASDIDYILLTKTVAHDPIIRNAITTTEQEFHVPFQVQAIDLAAAKKGMHSCDEPFQEHLLRHLRKHGYQGKNPLDYLAPTGMIWEQALHHAAYTYLRSAKKLRLHQGTPKEYLEQLSKTLTQVPHIFRILLQSIDGPATLHNDTKTTIYERYCKLPIDETTKQTTQTRYETLRDVVSRYNQLLNDRKTTPITTKLALRYLCILDELRNLEDLAFGIIHDNVLLLKV